MKKELLLTAMITASITTTALAASNLDISATTAAPLSMQNSIAYGGNNKVENDMFSPVNNILLGGDKNTVRSSASDSITSGRNNTTSGPGSIVAGWYNTNSATHSLVVGTSNTVGGTNNIVGGFNHANNDNAINSLLVGAHNSVDGKNSVALGMNNSIKGNNALAIGYNAKAKNDYATAVGYSSTGSGNQSSAFGFNAEATAMNTTAVGSYANASGAYSTALGFKTAASNEDAVALGNYSTSAGKSAFAAGTLAKAAEKDSLAIGHSATTTKENGIAIGTNAMAATDNSIALGAKSVTDTAVSTSSGVIGGRTYSFAGGNAVGTLSIGDSGAERTITNVAAGRVSATSTDAVNGSQLHAIKDVVDNHENRITTIEGDINTLNNRIINGGANSLNEAKAYTDQQVSSVAAASAALAGLHPLDFDKHDKWSYSVGFGNYKNANAAALGAFYRPNKNTMFNAATTVGNGRNSISLGANFKFGKSSEEVTTEDAAQLKKDMKDLSEKYNELAQKYNELAAKLESK